ncbi:hypothetical protein [Micromonospora sp. NPDC003241]
MNQLTPEESELLAKYLNGKLGQQDAGLKQLAEVSQRLRTHNNRVEMSGYSDLITSEVREHGLSYADAANKVAQEHPDLYRKYCDAVSNCGHVPDSGVRDYGVIEDQ